MEAFDFGRNHWDQLNYSGDPTPLLNVRQDEFLLLEGNHPLTSRYGDTSRNDSTLLDSHTAPQSSPILFDAVNEQMSRPPPEFFSDRTTSGEKPLKRDICFSPVTNTGMTMAAIAATPDTSRPRRAHSATNSGDQGRIFRNRQEKVRRDKISEKVTEMGKYVHVIGDAKRSTKIDTLRHAAAAIRLYWHVFKIPGGHAEAFRRWKPDSVDETIMNEVFEKATGFILMVDIEERVLCVSQNVAQYTGFLNTDMMGEVLSKFVHETDADTIRREIQVRMSTPLSTFRVEGNQLVSPSFGLYCRFLEKSQTRSRIISYKVMRFNALVRGPLPTVEEPNLNLAFFKLTVFVQEVDFSPSRRFGLNDAIQNEYVTRHNKDGTIVFADHRISTVTGYFPEEVFQDSAHNYMVSDDVPVASFALQQMLRRGQGTVVYRLITKSKGYIYLRSSGHVCHDSTSMEAKMFECINTLLPDDYGELERLRFLRRHSSQIGTNSASNGPSTVEGLTSGDSSDSMDEDGDVFGGRSTNPLALENLVLPGMRVSQNTLLREAPRRETSDNEQFGAIVDMTFSSDSSENRPGTLTPRTMFHTSPEMRESSSPEFQAPLTPVTSNSPINGEIEDPRLLHGNFSLPNQQMINNSGIGIYPANSQWLYPNSGAFNTVSPANNGLIYSRGAYASPSPVSMSPDPEDAQQMLRQSR